MNYSEMEILDFLEKQKKLEAKIREIADGICKIRNTRQQDCYYDSWEFTDERQNVISISYHDYYDNPWSIEFPTNYLWHSEPLKEYAQQLEDMRQAKEREKEREKAAQLAYLEKVERARLAELKLKYES